MPTALFMSAVTVMHIAQFLLLLAPAAAQVVDGNKKQSYSTTTDFCVRSLNNKAARSTEVDFDPDLQVGGGVFRCYVLVDFKSSYTE